MNDGATQGPPALLRVEVERDTDSATVVLVGELDIGTRGIAEGALEQLRSDGIRRLIVDLRPVTFIGSTGLRLLFELAAACERDGQELVLVRGSKPIDRLFELAGLEDQLPFVTRG